jgi:hypothetical protein
LANYLKNSSRGADIFQAQRILKEMLETETVDHQRIIYIIKYLCDILILELKISDDPVIIEELRDLTNRLSEIAETQSSTILSIETRVLQSKFDLLEFNIVNSIKLLEEAHQIASSKNLINYAKSISEQRDGLMQDLNKWNQLSQSGATILERMKEAQIEEFLELAFENM